MGSITASIGLADVVDTTRAKSTVRFCGIADMHLVGDMVALVSALGETQAAIVGHDWRYGRVAFWFAAARHLARSGV
jgi:pimeloyl-ACP methyl ester carboxylesterase